MIEIKLRGKAKALETQNLFGISPFSVAMYLASLLGKGNGKEDEKYSYEEYNERFLLFFRKVIPLGTKNVFAMSRDASSKGKNDYSYKNHKISAGYSTMLERPRVFYDLSIVLPDRNDDEVFSFLVKENKFLGYFPVESKVRKIKSLKEVGSYLAYKRKLKEKSIKHYIDELIKKNEEKTRVYSAILGYLLLENTNQKITRKGIDYEAYLAEPLYGLINLKGIYQLLKDKSEEEVIDSYSWFLKENKNSIEITNKIQ